MAILTKLEKLVNEKDNVCVTLSLNTHRTHPDNALDEIVLKNLLKEAEERVISEFGKRPVAALLDRLSSVAQEIDVNYNLDSLHLFLSNDTQEIVKSNWPTPDNVVHISQGFSLRSLIQIYNQSEEYLVMLLSQSGVTLYEALNGDITGEVRNDDFPFSENPHYNTHRSSDSQHLDDLVREFLNKVDKAVVKVHNETGLKCVVVCTEDNYSRLMQVADKATIYHGYANVNYNKMDPHHLVEQTWEIVQELQSARRVEAVNEVKEAVGQGLVVTDLQEIFQAALDGRGDLLVLDHGAAQPVRMTGDRTFELVDDPTEPDVIDDITSRMAWEVLSKKGRVVVTDLDESEGLGRAVLKARY